MPDEPNPWVQAANGETPAPEEHPGVETRSLDPPPQEGRGFGRTRHEGPVEGGRRA